MLLTHRVRNRVRDLRAPGRLGVACLMGFLGAYLGFTLVVLGTYLPAFTARMAPGQFASALVDRYALEVLIALFFMRFLLQQTPRMRIRPYLHLPVGRRMLVGFFVAASAVSAHNVFPLLFAVPYAAMHLAEAHSVAGAVQWVGAVAAFLLVSNFLNLYLRTVLHRHERTFLILMAALLVVSFADEYLGVGLLGRLSTALFAGLHRPDVFNSLALAAVTVATALVAFGALLAALREDDARDGVPHRPGRLHELAQRWDLAGHLIWLELRLMWRNRRPRHYLLVSLLFSTVYLVFMLLAPLVSEGFAFGAVIGLFASGGFALNYGQLMFAWDSDYLEGLLARDVRSRVLARSKVIVLQASCLVLFVVSLPLFLWLRPDLVPLHVAFLFYNAGVTTQIVLELATRNRERVDIARTGGFFNYEGFSARHWLWFLPTAVPPALLLFLLRDRPGLALTLLALVGLAGLATTEFWTRRHATRVERNKYRMLTGFASPS